MDIPLIVTEQYPKGLGSTVSELNVGHAVLRVEKTVFSMAVPEVTNALKKLNRSPLHVVLFGLEVSGNFFNVSDKTDKPSRDTA